MVLETQKILLRPFKETDLEDLYEYSSQSEVCKMAGWKPHTAIDESRQVLNNNIKNPNIFAIEYKENLKVIGYLAIHKDSENDREDTKELGFALNQNYQRRGIMTEVVHKILDYLFSGGIQHVYACCFQENIPSKKLIEKCGFIFEKEGTFYSPSLNKNFKSFEYVYHNTL